jgi:nicotinamide-nucleotide amidase
VPESRIADAVQGIVLPGGISLAYLPGWEGVDLRLTSGHMAADLAQEKLSAAVNALTPAIGDSAYGADGDDLAAIVIDALRARGLTIAVGESCTGGMLGMRLTSMPGSSDVFLGGVIAYDNRVKMSRLGVSEHSLRAHGAVSDEVAQEMASGARAATGADIGIGITGIAGPGGGAPDKPVGLVAIAIDGAGAATARSARFIGDRDEVRRRATQAALNMVRLRTFAAGTP